MEKQVEALNMGGNWIHGTDASIAPLADVRAYSPTAVSAFDELELVQGLNESETTAERVLGRYETLELRPDQYVTLAQVRGERNIVTDELKESIMRRGLINLPDVTLLPHGALEEYVAFTNRTWGADASIEQFAELRLPDGRYPLIKAGLSRHQAVTELVAEGRLPYGTKLATKLSSAESVWDIVQWQIDENIHSQPPQERRAMALVESYSFGLSSGQWANEGEFIAMQKAAGHDIKKGPLDQALKYARLEPRIRNFVLAGQVPYLAGVEMGATADILTEFTARRNGFDGITDPSLTPEQRKKIKDTVTMEFDILCNRITGDRLNSTAAKKLIQGKRTTWDELAKQMRPNGRARKRVLDFQFSQDQLDIYYEAKKRELTTALKDLSRKYRGSDIAGFLQLQRGILPEHEITGLLQEFETELERTKATLGGLSTAATIYDGDLFGK